MRAFAGGAGALAGLAVREAVRQRLWIPVLAVCALVAVLGARLETVDAASRQKLAVALVVTSAGFVANLLAIVVAAQGVRRDLESRIALLLFSKPLPRSAYLLGRWCGGLACVAAALAALAAVGVCVCGWRAGLPICRTTVAAGQWRQLTAAGAAVDVPREKAQVYLTGAAGNGVRLRFAGVAPGEHELLLRAAVLATESEPVGECRVHVAALVGGADLPLALAPASPYGTSAGAAPGVVALRSLDESRTELDTDYARLRLPAAAVVDGAVEIRLTRIESNAALRLAQADSALLSVPGGGFALNLGRAALAMLAGCAPLAAWTLLCACVSNLGVALLGGLTLLFAGSALPALDQAIGGRETALPLRRLLGVLRWIIPDFDRHHLAARLAATRAVEWSAVGDAFAYYGAYAGAFLLLAWWALRTREVA